MSLVSTWLHGIGLANAEIIGAFEKAGIVEPEALAFLEMNQYESLGVVEPADRKKLFHLVQRVKIAVEESTAHRRSEKERQKNQSSNSRKSNLEGEYCRRESRQPLRGASSKLSNDSAETGEDLDTFSSFSGSVGASSLQSNPRRNMIASTEYERDGLRLLKRQSSSSRLRESETASTSNNSSSSRRHSERIRGRPNGNSSSRYQTKLERNEHNNSSSTVGTSIANNAPLSEKAQSSTYNRLNSSRRQTIHVFSASETSNDSTSTSPLTTPESIESSSEQTNLLKSESLKVKYSSKNESKKLSTIPAGLPAMMSPLQDKSNNPIGSDVAMEEESVKDRGNAAIKPVSRGRSLSSNRRASAPSPHYKKPQQKKAHSEARRSNVSSMNNDKDSSTSRVQQKKGEYSGNYVTDSNAASAVFIHGEPEDNSWGAQVESLRDEKNREFANICPLEDEEEQMRIRVVVRKRPMSKREASLNEVDIIHPFHRNGRLLVYQPKTRVDLTREIDTSAFAFDNVFENDATNSKIYDTCIKSLIPGVFEGKWVSVFAYGQTGSGKSFTMLGSNLTGMKAGNSKEDRANLGVYLLAAQDVFKYASDSKNSHLSVSVSLFEIYGGKLLDLLNNRAQVKCLEDHKGKVCFPGLSEHGVKNPAHIMQIIEAGAANRSMGSTSANADSSRSHAVLQLSLRKRVGKKSNVEHGRLSFIDLAGSERGADTNQASRTTRLEGAEINTSLLALKEVIRALAVGGTMQHIPFRGSKLTQVLKESFVGKKSRTVMIACVAPNLSNCEHTLNTLRYADRVKERSPETGKPAVGNAKNPTQEENKPSSVKKAIDSDPSVLFLPDQVEVFSDKSYFDDFSSCETIDGNCADELNDGQHSDVQLATEEECIQDVINGELRKVSKNLIATHSASMEGMLNMVQEEASLVHTAGTQNGKIKEYIDGLEKCQARKLEIISNMRDSLTKYQEARDLIHREASAFSRTIDSTIIHSERIAPHKKVFYSEDEFEDLRD